jgi:hypothetical protein
VAFIPDGSKVVSGSGDKTLRLWDVNTGATIRTFTGHTSYVTSVAFIPDGSKVVSGSGDKTLRLWDVTTGVNLRTFTPHPEGMMSVALSPDGTKVVSGANSLSLWSVNTGTKLHSITDFNSETVNIAGVAFSPDGKTVAFVSNFYPYFHQSLGLWDNVDLASVMAWICANRVFRQLTPAEMQQYGVTDQRVCGGQIGLPPSVKVAVNGPVDKAAAPHTSPSPSPSPTATFTATLDAAFPQRIESDAPPVQASTGWQTIANIEASGGGYSLSGTPGDSLTLPFEGATIAVVYLQHPAMGSFSVVVDGVVHGIYTAQGEARFGAQVVISGLTPGGHTLRLVADQTPVAIDAFIINPTIEATLTPTATVTPDITETPTVTATPSLTATATPTDGATPELGTPTETPVETATPEPTQEVTASPTASAMPTATETPVETATPEPTQEVTASPTASAMPTATDLPTATPPSPSDTPTAVPTPPPPPIPTETAVPTEAQAVTKPIRAGCGSGRTVLAQCEFANL